jgi:nucleotide-binding universal stress UspA family protein
VKYLLPIDGSSACRRAENFARRLLDPETDSLVVLCVVEATPLGESGEDSESTSIRSRITEEADLVVDEAVDRLESEGYPVERLVAHGDAGETILEVARNEEVDGIIIGRQGKGKVEELLLGSVSKYVVRNSPVPVLTVPSQN